MATYIHLEPSTDIHLVLDPGFQRDGNPLNDVELKVFGADFDGAAGRYDLQELTSDLHFDFFPIDQNIVSFDPSTQVLTPQNRGTVLMQVRYDDPALADDYHYLIAHIQVHQQLDGWWFGNDSLSVFQDADLAHSQVSIYALFDKDDAGRRITGDITGHGYVELTSADTSFAEISAKYRGRIQGKQAGDTQLSGELLGGDTQTLEVKVVDFNRTDIPILQRTTRFHATAPRREKLNLLHGLGDGDHGSAA